MLASFIHFEHQEFIFIYIFDELWLSRLHHLQTICLYKVVKIDLRDKYHITWYDRIGCSIVTHFPLKMTFQVCKRGRKGKIFSVRRPIENIFLKCNNQFVMELHPINWVLSRSITINLLCLLCWLNQKFLQLCLHHTCLLHGPYSILHTI